MLSSPSRERGLASGACARRSGRPERNAIAETLVETFRRECLDHLIILNESRLQATLGEFVAYYNVTGRTGASSCRPPSSESAASAGRLSAYPFSAACITAMSGLPEFALRQVLDVFRSRRVPIDAA